MKTEYDLDDDGFTIIRGLMQLDIVDKYVAWAGPLIGELQKDQQAFQKHAHVRNILCNQRLLPIMGMDYALHSCLLRWTHFGLPLHCDTNDGEPHLAVWVALDNVDIDDGRFMIIPGSHKWDFDRSAANLEPETASISPAVHAVLDEHECHPEFFTASKGDVLVWNTGTLHGAVRPKNQLAQRKAAIGHYSPAGENVSLFASGLYWSTDGMPVE
jgi:ectoine hydroxylase-related dioxygenase (phytanoyl-CoA dioxygenase family)